MYELLCSSGFCGLMIVACSARQEASNVGSDAKLHASYGVAYKKYI